VKKTLGELVDELCIVNMKIFTSLNTVNGGGGTKEIAEAAIIAEKLNKRRSILRNAIDEWVGVEGESIKVYARSIRQS